MDQQMLITVKRALLRELDTTLQHSCHQSLQDIITDLRIRYVNISPDPSPDEVVDAMVRHDILRLRAAPRMARLCASLDRWQQGMLGVCDVCGKEIPPPELERDPSQTRCRRCERVQ